ncbi:hypothetical protein MTR67_033458 [Solanum verrucosum]|uniref:Reverse transcriptase Ty1/copia-type domain-containing protein n=1 Tax=Solanum verrucosum TaxID=315347 RepID=A0AAF0U619_SOLVR|nr:hypothetical protein MTR67_033458 [Solanum verrucosum]
MLPIPKSSCPSSHSSNTSFSLLDQASQQVRSHSPTHFIAPRSLSNIPVASFIPSYEQPNHTNVPSTVSLSAPQQIEHVPFTDPPEHLPPSTDFSYPTITPSYFRPSDTSRHHMVIRSKTNSLKPKALITSRHSLPLDPYHTPKPTTYHQASKFPEWHHAMQIEFLALIRNKTWTLVPLPSNSNIVGCKWVYRIKRKVDGSIERHKARLVAKGFHQEEGVVYFDTFSPVVKPTTVRLILSLAVTNKWSVRQLDINNAFLNDDFFDQVFMEQPKGFVDLHRPHFVCKLNKALYGLKQAPRAWFNKLKAFLLGIGFLSCLSDSSLFVQQASKHTTYVLVYVDDLIITGSDSDFITTFIHILNQQFSLKDLGSLYYFLGIEVSPSSNGIILSQGSYICDLLRRTNMADAKHISNPTEPGSRLILSGDPLSDAHLYRSVVGALQYVTITRPEISYAVNRVCQFMQSPTVAHWSAIKRILRYLKGSIHDGLLLRPMSDSSLVTFSDAGWISDPDDSHSQHGFALFYGGNLISWSSRKQKVVARSSTKVEYRALAFATTELIWVQQLISELYSPLIAPPIVFCDNLNAQFLSRNPVIHQRSKHIRLDYHFIREMVEDQSLVVHYVSSQNQIADIFIKVVGTSRFLNLRSKLMVRSRT